MDLSSKELKIILPAMYKHRSNISGASQAEKNKLKILEELIDKIEGQVGPINPKLTSFDKQMTENLSIMQKGKVSSKKKKQK
jgi:hypothetical protein